MRIYDDHRAKAGVMRLTEYLRRCVLESSNALNNTYLFALGRFGDISLRANHLHQSKCQWWLRCHPPRRAALSHTNISYTSGSHLLVTTD
jgi:hypothetical protein